MPTSSDYYHTLHNKYNFDDSVFTDLSHDLKLLKKINPFIYEIGIDGGSVVDIVLGFSPTDYDVRYSVLTPGSKSFSKECLCDKVKNSIDGSFKVLTQSNTDLGNINEGDLCLSLNYRYLNGLVGNHCFTNMVLFTENKDFVCSKTSFDNLFNRVYTPNFYGYFEYSYRGEPRKSHNELLLEMLVRGVAYVVKRKLSPDDEFIKVVSLYPELKLHTPNFNKIVQLKFRNVEVFEEKLKELFKVKSIV